jgi:uncharacterized RDD family membrane protein YckC
VALDTVYLAETPEGIALSLSPAGPVARFWALLIDTLLKIGLWIACITATSFLGGLGRALLYISFFAIEWIYPIAFELAMGGATPGKRALGLQVVMDSGLPVTPAASITRNLLRAADFLPVAYAFGAVSMLLRRDFKRLGDLAAGTIVVHAAPVSLHADLPPGAPVAPARPLSLREQAAIVSWAGRAASLTAERLEELARMARPVTQGRAGQEAAARAGAEGGDTAVLLGVAQWLIGRRDGAAS